MAKNSANSQFQTIVPTRSPRFPLKIILFVLLGLVSLVLVAEGVYYFAIRPKRLPEAPPERPVREVPPLLSFEKLKSDLLTYKASYPIVVNGEPVTWEELEEAIRYDQEVWQIRGHDYQEEKKLLIDRFVERKLIEEQALKQGIGQPTTEEIERAKADLFGENYDFSRVSSYPEFQAEVKTKALKDKIEKSMIKSYSGALIYVKFYSLGAREMKWKDPKEEARRKIEELYEKAKAGIELSELVALANNDPEVMKLNDNAKMEEFEDAQIEDLRLPSPEYKETVESLLPGQLSDIVTLTAIMRPDLGTYEDFAYGFVKLKEVSGGQLESFEALLNQMRQEAEIKVNI